MATKAHTVPRFHLNHFVSPECEGPEPFVWVGDISTGTVKRRAAPAMHVRFRPKAAIGAGSKWVHTWGIEMLIRVAFTVGLLAGALPVLGQELDSFYEDVLVTLTHECSDAFLI